ncbi:MAG: cytochrome-c peroxidase [Flavobacteriales bacterium]
MKIRLLLLLVGFITISGFAFRKLKWTEEELKAQKVEIGRQLFFDKALSNPDGQSCTVCHAPKTSFSDPNHVAVSEGMLDGFFVNRNSQTLTYTSYTPPLAYDAERGTWYGGFFWDGRSSSLQHQLSGPFFNIAEMNNSDTTMLVSELKNAPYYKLYKSIYGKVKDETIAYNNIIESIALFEGSEYLNEFSSKYDYWLQGKAIFNQQEEKGRILFDARCASCHSSAPQPTSGKMLFTDYGYHNLGLPRNEDNPFYTTDSVVNPLGKNAIDLGLGAVVKDEKQNGKFRTPSLRNVEYTSPYFHNGYFSSLKEAVHFINTRNDGHYALPEVKENIETGRIGTLHLSEADEQAIVAFLLTLSDGYEL